MATEVEDTIQTSGGDYASISAWEIGTDNDLVTADEIRIGVLYIHTTTGYWTSASLTFAGATVDSTRYRVLRGNSAETTGIAGTGPRVRLNNGAVEWVISENYIRFEDFEFYGDTGHSNDGFDAGDSGNYGMQWTRLLIHDIGDGSAEIGIEYNGASTDWAYVMGCVVYDIASSGVLAYDGSAKVKVWQCTFDSCSLISGAGRYAVESNAAGNIVDVENTCVFNTNGGNHIGGGGTTNKTNVATDDTEGTPAALQSLTDTNQFTAPGSNDWTVKDSSAAIYHAGNPISGGPTTDPIGTAYDTSTPSVGAFELAGGAPAAVKHFLAMMGAGK